MKGLINEQANIRKMRFWGKIFGIKNDYYITEADFDTIDDSEFVKYQESLSDDAEFNGKIPSEQIGDGVNQKIFYVSTGSKLEILVDLICFLS
jgi:hypothetical protein